MVKTKHTQFGEIQHTLLPMPPPTNLAHINTNTHTILGGPHHCPVLGKSLTCDPRLGVRLVVTKGISM